MKALCSFAVASLLVAFPTLAASSHSEAPAIMLHRNLSPGVRLHSLDGQRRRFAKAIPLAAGTHVFEFTYAYDEKRDQAGPWVSRLAFECSVEFAGTYTLRSKDGRIGDQMPLIWIESENQVAPKCKRVGA